MVVVDPEPLKDLEADRVESQQNHVDLVQHHVAEVGQEVGLGVPPPVPHLLQASEANGAVSQPLCHVGRTGPCVPLPR